MKREITKLLIGAALYAAAFITILAMGWGMHGEPPWEDWHTLVKIAMFMPSYLVIGGSSLLNAARNIINGQVFDEFFLMAIATIGAFVLGECFEGVAVMLFFQVGQIFEDYAVNRSRASITELMDIRPDYANVKRDGKIERVDPYDVELGQTIVINPGEKVPLDGTVIAGSSLMDTKALTGESVPREANVGDEILSGCINSTGVLEVQVTKSFGESTVTKILDLVENASSKKSPTENFITKFAKYYTPIVCVLALLIAVLPPLFFGIADWGVWMLWIRTALSFLVVSCPCALVISVPLSFFGGIGCASKEGVLIKGSNYLEAMSKAEIVVFDKTGTLTKGTFRVTEIHSEGMSEAELLGLTAHAEGHSSHPISLSLREAYGKPLQEERLGTVEEIAGHGLKATVDGRIVLAGNGRLMEQYQIPHFAGETMGTVVHVAVDGVYAGSIVISDEVKPDAEQAIREMKDSGIRKTVMLTGDNKTAADIVARKLGVDQVHAELLPGDKVDQMEALMAEKSERGKLVFVGDGINDAPVLARADIGVAMGGLGSDAAIEAADIVIMRDEPSKLAVIRKISQKTLSIVYQNIVFALAIKTATQVLSVTQVLGDWILWLAVFADVGVSMLAILNAIRALRYKESK